MNGMKKRTQCETDGLWSSSAGAGRRICLSMEEHTQNIFVFYRDISWKELTYETEKQMTT
jgi:hypothetical protein